MMPRKFKFTCLAAISLLGVAFGVAPAAAWGCGYYGCGGNVVLVQPQPYVYQSCSCCGCGASSYSYGAYAPTYVSPPSYYYGGYGANLYQPGYYGGYRGGFHGAGYWGGYRGGFYRRGYVGGFRGRW